MTGAIVLASLACITAVVQLVASAHRDLGIVPIALAGCSVLAGAPFGPVEAALLAGAAVVAGIAWWRAGRHGVGRPALNGVGLLVAMASAAALRWLPGFGVPTESVVAVGVGLGLLTALVGLAMALERPGPRRRRPRYYRTVPVE